MTRIEQLDLKYKKRFQIVSGVLIFMSCVTVFSLSYAYAILSESEAKINHIKNDDRIPYSIRAEVFDMK